MRDRRHTPGHADIFADVEAHMASGRFIRAASTNPVDIREFALEGVDLGGCRSVLDVGCSYGFFTRGLAGRLPAEAKVTGLDLWEGCEPFFLAACRESGFAGTFFRTDPHQASPCAGLPDNGFDFVLCTYALYFFPDAVADLARVLRPGGQCVIVTHCVPHMEELVATVKEALARAGGQPVPCLPLEELFTAFSDENGPKLLAPHFTVTLQKRYENAIRVDMGNLDALIDYLCFKRPKFIPRDVVPGEGFLRSTVAGLLREKIRAAGALFISKNDMVFVCRRPDGREEG
ncbi:MAG: hypothetical protein Kow0089_18850 [Desulfobulbaceae bacterium]